MSRPLNSALISSLLCLAPSFAMAVPAARIKDLVEVAGVRPNQLIGYGIVVGLSGSGDTDKARFTVQSVVSMLSRMGIRIEARGLKLKNVAAVVVTAELPAYSRTGTKIDVTVNSVGDAKSLVGGTLLAAPLKGHDGKIYVVAQGPLTVGGYSVSDEGGGNRTMKNHPTVARVPDGGIVERELDYTLARDGLLALQLREPDFTTAARLAKTINMNLGESFAKALDGGTVEVRIPTAYEGRVVELLSLIERLTVTPDTAARVVVNERTGTIVIGEDVKIGAVAVTHGNLTVRIRSTDEAVPASPFTSGPTVRNRKKELSVDEPKAIIAALDEGATLSDIVEGLNRLGATPRDLITILQAIRQAGALRATVEVQ